MIKFIDGGVCAAKGFTAGGIGSGIKTGSGNRDLAMVYCSEKCAAAALFTQNRVKAAPVLVTQSHLADGTAQAVIVNSGNANACNSDGMEIAEKTCALTAKSLDVSEKDVIVASTGVIGQALDIRHFETGVPALAQQLSGSGNDNAAAAIMTTDTFAKQCAVEFEIGGKICKIGGMAKGSGMINPNMATMLAFITTDVAIENTALANALKKVNADTFNMVSVDGDTSTNDMVCVMASGLAGNAPITGEGGDYSAFEKALYAVMADLAKKIARDGEGATKLIECEVVNADNSATAKSIAKSVISSSLVKAALGAADANWGRILCAIGYSEGRFDVGKVEVALASDKGEITVCANGTGVPFSEEKASGILSPSEIKIIVDLHSGNDTAVAWGCDLTQEYVRINADYRS